MSNAPLVVGMRVDRDDGRFYIPIHQGHRIVMRVASDAFDGDEMAATDFAIDVATAYNVSR